MNPPQAKSFWGIFFARHLAFFGLLAILTVGVSSCGGNSEADLPKRQPSVLQGNAQGTTFTIRYFDAQNRDFSSEVTAILELIDENFSWYIPNSLVSKYNNAAPGDTIWVNEEFVRMLQLSYSISSSTNRGFSPAVKPLVDYWGFGAQEAYTGRMDSTVVDSIQSHCNLDSLFLDLNIGETQISQWGYLSQGMDTAILRKSAGLAQLDFNAIAQGYAVDVIALFLESKGALSYMVELGGELRVGREKPTGDAWRIQIDMPGKGDEHIAMGTVGFIQRSVATSGNYRKYHEVDGNRVVHTMNPQTGYPVINSLLSATIFATTAAEADAMATASMVNGYDWARDFISSSKDLDAILIYDVEGEMKVWVSERLQDQFTPAKN